MRHCFEGCGSLECVSDICTRSCRVDGGSCADLSPQARCTNTSVEPGAIAVCDLSCSGAADCGALGEGFACDGGFCRSSTPPANGGGGGGGGGLDLGNVGKAGAAAAGAPACSLSDGTVAELGLDASPCAERRALPCDVPAGQTQQAALDQQLDDIMKNCGAITEVAARVVFESGCATRLSAALPSLQAPEEAACIGRALDLVRFVCADGLDCASVAHSTLK